MSTGGFLRANLAGIVDVPALNATTLYINGKPFTQYLAELTGADIFEQQEIDELKLLVQYLNTSGLSSEWIVDNQNKNQDLKTAITAIQTKLANIDTTALSESSVLTNDNRNSVLKTRIDGNDSDLSTLNGKTRYQSSVVGSNSEPRSYSTFNVNIADREKRQIYLTTGANSISSINDSTNQSSAGNYSDNQIDIVAQTGMVRSVAHLNSIQSIDTIEITGFGGMGIQSSPNIKIGNKGAQIKIGSEDTPELGSTNTLIEIGKRSITRNTETRLQGNIKIVDARFDELSTSPAFTWTNLIGLIPVSNLPLWVASGILTSAIPNYAYSDLWAMAGVITKNGDVETTTTPKMRGYTVYDPAIDIDILPKVQTFLAKGDISETTLLGSIRQQVFDGEILLRNNNILATNVNWAISDAMDRVNALKLSNNDVELIAGAGANNSQLRISNTCTNGKMRFRMGSGGLQANAHDALAIYNDQASSQVLIAGSNVPSGYDTSSKLLVDHQNLTNGIKVTKANEGLITRVNHNNINTPSLTLQTNWGGAVQNTLYLNASNQLMYNGSAVGAGAGGSGASTGGIIFLLRGPTTSVTYTAANLTPQLLTASDSYTGLPQRSIKLTTYNSGTTYNLYTHRGAINKITNPVIKGIWEYVINLSYSSNSSGSVFTDVYFYGDQNPGSVSVLRKDYAFQDQGGTGFIDVGGTTFTPYWFINKFQFQFVFTSVTFQLVNYRGGNMVFRCVLEDDSFTPLYTFPDITKTSNTGGTNLTVENLIFTAPSQQTITQAAGGFLFTGTKMRFKLTLVSGNSVSGNPVYYSQPSAASPNNISFLVPTGSYTTPLSLNVNNQTSLFFDTVAMRQYDLTIPIEEFDLTVFESPNFEIRFNFIQPSGTTSNHFVEAFFNDGSLSHCHTALNITNAIPRLDQVCAVSASTNNSIYFSNGSGLQNVSFITDTNSIPYAVKYINAGAGISITETANGIWSIASNTASGTTRNFRYFNNGIHVPKAVFNLGTPIDLRTHRVRGMIRAQLESPTGGQSTFQFPFLDFNNFHSYPTQTSTALEMNWITEICNGRTYPMYESSTYPARPLTHGRNANIAQIPTIGPNSGTAEIWFVTHFDITALYNNGFGNTQGLSCIGNHVMITKNLNSFADQYVMGDYHRHSQLGQAYSLSHIGFGSFTFYAANKGMQFVELNIEIIPYTPNIIQSSVGPV